MKSLCLWVEIHSKAIVFNSFNSLNSKTCVEKVEFMIS